MSSSFKVLIIPIALVAFVSLTGCGADETGPQDSLQPDAGETQEDAQDLDTASNPDSELNLDVRNDLSGDSEDETDLIEPDSDLAGDTDLEVEADPDTAADGEVTPDADALDETDGDDPDSTDAVETDTLPSPWLELEKAPGIPIAGQWRDEWASVHQITSTTWTQGSESGHSTFLIVEFDAAGGSAIAENDADNEWNGGKWSRFDWTWVGDQLYFCQTAYAAETREAAEATPAADPADPTTTGCCGFAWTALQKWTPVAIRGNWSDQWGSAHVISDSTWQQSAGGAASVFNFVSVDNESGSAIAQNDADNEWNGGKWSRFDWTWFAGDLYFCQTAYDADTREAAEATPAADATDPTTSGCCGFSWTILSPDALTADSIMAAPGDTGEGFGDAGNATNGVRGGGTNTGSTDVFSLGYKVDENNYITIEWTGSIVTNGPGADFVVFENGFSYSGSLNFMDQMVVLLSQDGLTWVPYPFDYTAADETVYSSDPAMWTGFAGVNPVLYNEDSNVVDPFDQVLAGGDQFDLDNLPDTDPDAMAIKDFGFSYLMIVAAPTVMNPDTGAPFVRDAISNGGDIDGVIARYVVGL